MPHKIAIVIHSNTTTEALSRTYRAPGFAAELMAAGDDVALVFDGGGSAMLAAILDPTGSTAGRSRPRRPRMPPRSSAPISPTIT